MTNYSKSFIQIITQKQKSFDLFKKNLKDVSLALENEDTAKATSLLEIYKTDMLALVIQRLKNTWISLAIQ